MTTTLTIPARLNGPPGSANGGIAAGMLADLLKLDESAGGADQLDSAAIQVSLRLPPPLGTPLRIERDEDGGLRAYHGADLVAEVRRSADSIDAVPAVDFEVAAEAATRFAGFADHPFPTCVGCGTDRTDGLACYAGPLDPDRPELVATPFVPRADLPREHCLTWAALDCAGGWAIDLTGRRAVLGRMTGRVPEVPDVGERCVVVAQCDGRDGRKSYSRSAAYGADGRLLGVSSATWIELR